MNNTYCIIMAGGVGSRFWPASTQSMPKQFLDILGTGETLIQQTYSRMLFACDPDKIYVVTSDKYVDLVLKQLPELKRNQVLTEPLMRNTAPCVAYAAHKIAAKDPEADLIITPADHLILKQHEFEKVITKALEHASTHDHLVTLGIKPTRPDTGYGYIEYRRDEPGDVKKVARFREKPDLKNAEKFVSAGNFAWNSGMFIWRNKTGIEAFQKHLPEVSRLFERIEDQLAADKDEEVIPEVYAQCPEISIDYGIMEKADNVHMIAADIGWSDLGTWGSVYDTLDPDPEGNLYFQGKIVTSESKNNLISIPEDKVAIVDGLEDYIVVDSDKALLIIRRGHEQDIKKLRKELGEKFGNEYI